MRLSLTGLLCALAACALVACSPPQPPPPAFGGDAARGKILVEQAQCGACHQIPGVEDAHGLVGPPLTRFGLRTTVAGVLPNTPPQLVRWLRDPQGVTPGNAMPSTNLTDPQARDVAAFLYTLR
jgi:cytochrome c1